MQVRPRQGGSLTLELQGHAVGPAARRTPGPGSLVKLGQEAVNLHFSAHYGQFCERHGPAQKRSGVLVTPQRLHDSRVQGFCTDKSNMHQKSKSGTDEDHLHIEQRVSSGVTCTPAIASEMPAQLWTTLLPRELTAPQHKQDTTLVKDLRYRYKVSTNTIHTDRRSTPAGTVVRSGLHLAILEEALIQGWLIWYDHHCTPFFGDKRLSKS
jgi:hypothetical protein